MGKNRRIEKVDWGYKGMCEGGVTKETWEKWRQSAGKKIKKCIIIIVVCRPYFPIYVGVGRVMAVIFSVILMAGAMIFTVCID